MKLLILFISFLLSIIPVIIIGYNFYKKDTVKEPKKLLRNLFISGIFSGLIVVVISIFGLLFFPNLTNLDNINNLFILIFYSYIFIALVEESCKLFMIYKISYNSKEFDQAFDIILYSVFVGLGFATFENIVYIIGNPGIQVAFIRGITAIPAHVCFQTLMGYYLYLSKIKDKSKYVSLSLIIPFLLHGTYDFLVFTNSIILILFDLGLLIFMFILASAKINKLIEIDKNNLNKICPNCKTIINYNYCSNCGYKKK